jgi:hypothetical protein
LTGQNRTTVRHMDAGEVQRRRIKAARMLGGFASTKALAKELGPGLSDKTIKKIEAHGDPRLAEPHELEQIARACGIDPGFFQVDLAHLNGQVETSRVYQLEARLERLEETTDSRINSLNATVAALSREREPTRVAPRRRSDPPESLPGS